MAVDEVLLESAIEHQVATVRGYQWREPTLSLGYFQPREELQGDPRWQGVPIVRRLSGGGTLLHDDEWTYSIALPGVGQLVPQLEDVYAVVHAAITSVLQRHGFPVSPRGVTHKQSNEPTLCFARQDRADLVCEGHKVLGSAQRRRRGALLQHGGLLLGRAALAPEFPGLRELVPTGDWQQLLPNLASAIAAAIAEEPLQSGLTEEEIAAAEGRRNDYLIT